jgi:hypothetical protein
LDLSPTNEMEHNYHTHQEKAPTTSKFIFLNSWLDHSKFGYIPDMKVFLKTGPYILGYLLELIIKIYWQIGVIIIGLHCSKEFDSNEGEGALEIGDVLEHLYDPHPWTWKIG